MNKAVFLDRDGVINHAIIHNGQPYPPANKADLHIIDNVEASLKKLKQSGFKLLIITNQPDVARGTTTVKLVEEIHLSIKSRLPIDKIYTCYHDDKDNCDCRKPKPGFFLEASEEFSINLSISFMVGDRWKDIKAGQAAGCKTIFIDNKYSEPRPDPSADHNCFSLAEAVPWILSN